MQRRNNGPKRVPQRAERNYMQMQAGGASSDPRYAQQQQHFLAPQCMSNASWQYQYSMQQPLPPGDCYYPTPSPSSSSSSLPRYDSASAFAYYARSYSYDGTQLGQRCFSSQNTHLPPVDGTTDRDRSAQRGRKNWHNIYKSIVWLDAMRKWANIPHEPADSTKSTVFKVMSYNVLAQELLSRHTYLYRKNNPKFLEWSHRWKYLRAELVHHSADIICLQEVQQSQLEDEYNKFFYKLGYNGIFKQRTGDTYPDGCAIFYNTRIFKLIEHHTVEYRQSDSRLLDRDNVGIVARFAPRASSGHSFVVATTHLLFNPRREDVRLAQVQLLLTEIDRIAFDQKTRKYLPVILCGDFNSDCKGGICELITQKRIHYRQYQRENDVWIPEKFGVQNDCKHRHIVEKRLQGEAVLTRQEEEKLMRLRHSERAHYNSDPIAGPTPELFDTGVLTHDFNFRSVYDWEGGGVSTHQKQWVAVDYLFYSKGDAKNFGNMQCRKRYELPTATQLANNNVAAIPNEQYGSDHFALVASFQFEH